MDTLAYSTTESSAQPASPTLHGKLCVYNFPCMTYTILADTFVPSARLTTPGPGRGHGVSLFFRSCFHFPRHPVGKRPFCIKYCILGCQYVLYILYFFSTVTPPAKVFKGKQKGFPQKEQVFLVENSQKPLDLPYFPHSFPHTVENSPFPHLFSTIKIPSAQICARVTKTVQLVKICMKFDSPPNCKI